MDYEAIQGDLFDHLLAILTEFGLRVVPAPGGADLGGLTAQLAAQQAGMAPPDRRSAQEG